MRIITLNNEEELKTLLREKAVIHKEIGEINEKLEKLDSKRSKLGHKINRIKEKMLPIIKEMEHSFKLSEFEIITNISIGEESKEVEIEVINQVEEYKEAIRQKKLEE